MADEKYLWLIWMTATTIISYFSFPISITASLFFAGLLTVCKCLVDEFFLMNGKGD
ncbi:hypothetical protein [Bacillus sp. REN3]|uniref:hypothetical protein n=1 Tax=Bacillus sp. REN3 TaxID=2802440 RepID=UPI001AED222F|nr:hypothetical protein [Bacillus sp. REN3]